MNQKQLKDEPCRTSATEHSSPSFAWSSPQWPRSVLEAKQGKAGVYWGEVLHTEKRPFALFLLYKEQERASRSQCSVQSPDSPSWYWSSKFKCVSKASWTFGSFSSALMQPYPREKARRSGWFWFSNTTKIKVHRQYKEKKILSIFFSATGSQTLAFSSRLMTLGLQLNKLKDCRSQLPFLKQFCKTFAW